MTQTLSSSFDATGSARVIVVARTRLAGISAWVWIGLLAFTSFVCRGVASLHHPTPRLFPDEYIYASLAHSLSHGHLAIRGTTKLFPALLEPLLAAPVWLTGNVGVAYPLTQWIHALAMSAAAVPVFLLARRLGLPEWQGVAAAAYTVSLPVLLYSSYLTADAVAFPLALAALVIGVRALAQPTRAAQLGFLTLAGLATLTRVQYIVLVPAFVVAALVMSGGRPLRALRQYTLTAVALALPLVVAVALGPRHVLGYYGSVFDLNVSISGIGHWIAVDLMLTGYASGWILIPAALIGLWACLVRPETPEERAFAALVTSFGGLLLLEAALYASNGSSRFQERYLMALLPLAPIAFGVGMRRLPSLRRPVIAAAACLLAIPFAVPLSGYVAGSGNQDSPFLQGVAWLGDALGDFGDASLVVAVLAMVLAVAALAAAASPRRGTQLALGAAIAVVLAGSVASTSFDLEVAHRVRLQNLPADASWVDHVAPGAAMLLAPGNSRPLSATHLFWNTSIDRVLVMAGSDDLDDFGSSPTAIGGDGTLLVNGKPFTGPLLVEEFGSTINLANGRKLTARAATMLWQTSTPARVETLAVGRYADAWLDRRAAVSAWPTSTGNGPEEMQTVLSLPDWATRPAVLKVTTGKSIRRITVLPGKNVVLRVPMKPRGETRTWLRIVSGTLFDATRAVSVMSTRPTVVAVPRKR